MSKKGRILVWFLFIALLLSYQMVEKQVRHVFYELPETQVMHILPNKTIAPMLSLGFQNVWADLLTRWGSSTQS